MTLGTERLRDYAQTQGGAARTRACNIMSTSIESTSLRRVVHLAGAVAAALLPVAAWGCGSETGLVVEVSQGDLPATPDTLRFHVGVSMDELELYVPGCGEAARFVEGADTADRVIEVAGRDLDREPYRLLLKPGDELGLDQPVMVAVAALAGDEVLGLAAIDGPVRFREGQVLEWQVALQGVDTGDSSMTGGCVCAPASTGTATGRAVIAPLDDTDCDGDGAEVDCDSDDALVGPSKPERCENQIDDNCNGTIDERVDADGDDHDNCDECDDTNELVYPGAAEICDGVDNNCNAEDGRYPDHVRCYARYEGQCYLGKRTCNDDDPVAGGWVEDCLPEHKDPAYRASDELCAAFDECTAERYDPEDMACADDATFTEMYCDLVLYNSGGDLYQPCQDSLLMDNPADLDSACRWTLMGGTEQEHYRVVFQALELDELDPGAVVEACRVALRVLDVRTAPPETPGPDAFRTWVEVDGQAALHRRFHVTARLVDSADACPAQGFTCTDAAALTPAAAGTRP